MLLSVSDGQFTESIEKIAEVIRRSNSIMELSKLNPSIVMVQRQAKGNRIFQAIGLVQDYTSKMRCLGVCYA